MKERENLTPEQQELFGELVGAIEKNKDIENILKKDCIREVLNTWVRIDKGDPDGCYYTVLMYAMYLGNIKAANAILDTVDSSVLQDLLTEKSYVLMYHNSYTTQNMHLNVVETGKGEMTALFYANEFAKSFTDKAKSCRDKNAEVYNKQAQEFKALAERIEKLKREDREGSEEIKKKDKERIEKVYTEKIERTKTEGDLFWAVLWRDGKVANDILESAKQKGNTIQILQSGFWVEALFIGDTQELAKKENKEIIKEIQTRQAIGIGSVGAALLVCGVLAGVFANPLFVIAAVIGLAGVIFAGYHGLKEIPSTEFDEASNAQHAPAQNTAIGSGIGS